MKGGNSFYLPYPKNLHTINREGMERWLSGRRRRTRNAVSSKGLREFESHPLRLAVYSPIWDLLPDLKKRNFKLAVINNGTGLTLEKFKHKNNFSQYFDLFINSSEEGIEKPDPQIYLLACERLGVTPGECVFIDDTTENVEAAEKLGMAGFLYKGNPESVKDFILTQRDR